MEYEFLHDGEVYIIKIDGNQSGEYKAVIGDREYQFSGSDISPNEFSILLDKRNMKAYAAASEENLFVHVGGRVILLKKPGSVNSGYGAAGTEFGVKDEVSTPMPGKVVKILVKEGDKVAAGQSLVIVESMKMENEIKSPAAGMVTKVNFSNGDLVEPGQPIIKLNPSA
jgi:biotin carboxyl carrier protein